MKRRTLILIALLLGLLTLFVGPNGFKVPFQASSIWSQVAGAAEESASQVRNYAVKKGDTFTSVMTDVGLSREQANNLLSKSDNIYDFTSITAGNLFQFVYRGDKLREIRYDINNQNQVVISSSTNGYRVSEKDIPYSYKKRTVGATIDDFLYKDARDAGLPDKVILQLAEIFAWNVDFAVDVREGDSFKLVYRELYRDGQFVGPGRILAARFTNKGEDHYAFYFKPKDKDDGKYYDSEGRAVVRQFLKSPLNYSHISSGFSYSRRNPVTGSYGAHRAIDYAAPPGTPVSATGGGNIAYAGWGAGKGRYVKIRHGGVFTTIYAHLSGFARGVRIGANVSQGQVIGYVGSTGLSTGPHLHYVMKKYGRHVNPLTFDLPPGEPIKDKYKDEFQKIIDKYKSKLQ